MAESRQSLVTPIDWKQDRLNVLGPVGCIEVANSW